MNDWRKRFAEKMDFVREAARTRFEEFAAKTVTPTFEEFAAFTAEHGVKGKNPLAKGEVRTYKFAVTENAYVLLTFRAAGLEKCEVLVEFAAPKHDKLPPVKESVDMADADRDWARRLFEKALDRFADAVADAYMVRPEAAGVLAGV